MKTEELYYKLELQPEVVEKLNKVRSEILLSEIEPYLNQMMVIETAGIAGASIVAILGSDKGRFKSLWCHLECARRVYERYMAMDISEDIFIATMKCFSRFISECKEKNGEAYFDRAWWTYRQLSMQIFRIGELEYELCDKNGEKYISVHIPSDAIFTRKNIDISLYQARIFMARYFPEYAMADYVCSSWLLAPELSNILSEESNILDFQKRFEIKRIKEEDKEFIEWLFQKPSDTSYEELPEKTSLQKQVKILLLSGSMIHEGYGVMKKKMAYVRCSNGENGTCPSIKERTEVLMSAYQDSEVQEIYDVSGGDIANSILPYLDYELIANSSKRFWGYSDLTTVLNAIYTKTGKVSVLYQMKFFREEMASQLFDVKYKFLQGDEMQGILVGGNIRCLLKLAGTEYWPDMTGKILLLEARSGKVPQMITFLSQLKQLGVFDKVSGILLGTFTDMESEKCTPTMEELVKEFAGDNLPIAKTYDIGHGRDAKAIMIGQEYHFRVQ